MPPAVKGLANIFKDGDQAITYEFSDWRMTTLGRFVMRMRDYLIEKEGVEKADGIISSWDVQELLIPPPESEDIKSSCYNDPTEEESMKPEEVSKLVGESVSEAMKQFSETMGKTIKGMSDTIADLKKSLDSANESGQRREFKEFLMTPEMQQRVNEGSREATINHMMSLVNAEPVMFEEAGERKTIPAVEDYKKQLRSLPEVVRFGEFATKDKAGKQDTGKANSADYGEAAVDQVRLKIHKDALAYQEANKGTTYDVALAHVMKGGN